MATETVAPWYRQFWFWFVLAPPMASIVLGLSLLGIAILNSDSMVVDNYETVGRALHKNYEREHHAAALGLGGSLVLDREQGQVSIRLGGLDNPPETLRLQFSHPTHAERDVELEMQRDDSGIYRGSAQRRVTGRHYVRLEPADGAWLLATEIAADQRELSLAPRPRGG